MKNVGSTIVELFWNDVDTMSRVRALQVAKLLYRT